MVCLAMLPPSTSSSAWMIAVPAVARTVNDAERWRAVGSAFHGVGYGHTVPVILAVNLKHAVGRGEFVGDLSPFQFGGGDGRAVALNACGALEDSLERVLASGADNVRGVAQDSRVVGEPDIPVKVHSELCVLHSTRRLLKQLLDLRKRRFRIGSL